VVVSVVVLGLMVEVVVDSDIDVDTEMVVTI